MDQEDRDPERNCLTVYRLTNYARLSPPPKTVVSSGLAGASTVRTDERAMTFIIDTIKTPG